MDTCWHTISEWTIEFLAEVPFGIGIFGKSGNAGNVGDVYGNVCGECMGRWKTQAQQLAGFGRCHMIHIYIYIYICIYIYDIYIYVYIYDIYICVCVLWCVMGMKRSSIHWVFRLLTTAPRRAAGTHPVGQGWNIYGTSVVRCRKKIVSWRFWKFFEHPNWSSMIFHDLPWSLKPLFLPTFSHSRNPEMSVSCLKCHVRAHGPIFAQGTESSLQEAKSTCIAWCWGVAEGLLRGWSRLTGWNGLSIGS